MCNYINVLHNTIDACDVLHLSILTDAHVSNQDEFNLSICCFESYDYIANKSIVQVS